MGAGALIDYRLKLHGVPVRWRPGSRPGTRRTASSTSRSAAPTRSGSTPTTFEADGEGATIIRDRVRYAIPLGPLGEIAHRLFVRRDLERIFDYRRDAVALRIAG